LSGLPFANFGTLTPPSVGGSQSSLASSLRAGTAPSSSLYAFRIATACRISAWTGQSFWDKAARRAASEFADIFRGGVLCTRLALAMDFNPFDG
jgi:hypothetical protein